MHHRHESQTTFAHGFRRFVAASLRIPFFAGTVFLPSIFFSPPPHLWEISLGPMLVCRLEGLVDLFCARAFDAFHDPLVARSFLCRDTGLSPGSGCLVDDRTG